MRFKMKYGRDATHADACEHLRRETTADGFDKFVRQYIAALREHGKEWSSPADGEPIAEPYAESDP